MRTRTRNAIALALAVSTLGGGLYWLSRTRDPVSPVEVAQKPLAIDAIPEGAMLLLTADLAALRKSDLGRPLFTRRREIPGLGRVDDVCGFDPLDTLEHLALGIPGSGKDGDFGLVATGVVASEPLARCAAQVIAARGGRPVETTIGSFRTVRDVSLPEEGGEIAVRQGGPVLLGAGPYLRAMIDTSEGRTQGVFASPVHRRLREQLGEAAIVVTFVFTSEQRRTIAAELEGAARPAPPIQRLVGVGASAAQIGQSIALRAVATCDDAAACQALATALEGSLRERADDLGLRLLGLAPALERAKITARGDALELTADLTVDEAESIVLHLAEGLGPPSAPALDPLDAGQPPLAPPDPAD